MALVYLDSCGASETDSLRPVVGIHELVHVFGAVNGAAPHRCNDGHVCDVEPDLMSASLSGDELETHVLDGGRDDYYGHSGAWPTCRTRSSSSGSTRPTGARRALPAGARRA